MTNTMPPTLSHTGEPESHCPRYRVTLMLTQSHAAWMHVHVRAHARVCVCVRITEMMVTKQEPFNAERLLLSTGITNNWCESNWTDSKYSDVGRVTPSASDSLAH